jgi:hypothetical protein
MASVADAHHWVAAIALRYRVPQGFTGDLVGSLRTQNVFVSQRGSSIRVAPHLHVTESDVQQLFDALDVSLCTTLRASRS